jgi:Protein of unknown function (DUF3486)
MADGRGRLSSLDLLPDEAGDDILWALGQLNERRRTQADILFELNDRLAVKGLGPISKSAFNRQSTKIAARTRRIAERQAIYAAIAPQLTPEHVGRTDLVLGEFLKTLIDEIIDEGELGSRGAMELARAFHATVSALKVSADHKQKLMQEAATKAAAAVDNVAREKGLTTATIDAIKAQILGVVGAGRDKTP